MNKLFSFLNVPLLASFKDNINHNMNLIGNEIKKEYEYFIKKLNKIKEHNKIYFKSQILKDKINDF